MRDSEHLELLWHRWSWLNFPAGENFHRRELFVGDSQNADVTFRRKVGFHTSCVHGHVLATRAVAQVRGKLKHREAVFDQRLPKLRIVPYVTLGFRRQIEENENPHDTIFVKPHVTNQGRESSPHRRKNISPAMMLCAALQPLTDFALLQSLRPQL